MVGTVVFTAPKIKMAGGLIRFKWKNGEKLYWKPEVLEQLVCDGALVVADWKAAGRVVPIRRQ